MREKPFLLCFKSAVNRRARNPGEGDSSLKNLTAPGILMVGVFRRMRTKL